MVPRERWARAWPAASVVVWLLGVVARCVYVLRLHHPRHYILTDARQLVDLAQKLIDAPANQVAYDTIWPPGTSAILAVLLARDPTGRRGRRCPASAVLPAAAARGPHGVADRRQEARSHRARVRVAAPGLRALGGVLPVRAVLSFAIGLAMWASLAVVAWERESDRGENRLRPVAIRCALGFAVGTTWGLATSFRPNALPVALLVGLGLAVHWWRARRRPALALLAGGLAGLVLIIAPLTHRCSCPQGDGVLSGVQQHRDERGARATGRGGRPGVLRSAEPRPRQQLVAPCSAPARLRGHASRPVHHLRRARDRRVGVAADRHRSRAVRAACRAQRD